MMSAALNLADLSITDQINAAAQEETNVVAMPQRPVFTVSKAKPLPAIVRGGKPDIYPWAQLGAPSDEGCESFFVPKAKVNSWHSSCTQKNKSMSPKRFVARADSENGVSGVRVYRTN
jgi:hypothetical protein